MVCPYAKNIRGAVAYCELLGGKVSTLKYPCKGRYQRCPIYRARAPRQAAREEAFRPVEEAPRASQEAGAAKPAEPVKATGEAAEVSAKEAAGARAGVEEGPQRSAEVEAAAEKEAREETIKEEAVVAGSGAWRAEKLVDQVCDTLVQASMVAFAESNRFFSGNLEELLALSSDYLDKVIYFNGKSGNAELRVALYRGLVVGVEYVGPEGDRSCGESAIKHINPSLNVTGMIYIVSLSALPALEEALKALSG